MGIVETIYAAAESAGLLRPCTWQPSDGSAAQTQAVHFSCADDNLLDGLAVGTGYEITYPTSVFVGLTSREPVLVGSEAYLVREVRAKGDGSERRATLTKV